MSDIDRVIKESCQSRPIELPRSAPNERHFIIENDDDLVTLCRWCSERKDGEANGQHTPDYYLCTIVANDERLLEDNTFKLYYVLSSTEGDFIILEYPLRDAQNPMSYPSIRDSFPLAEPLEREIYDLFGLTPKNRPIDCGAILHDSYPSDYHPLCRTKSPEQLKQRLRDFDSREQERLSRVMPELPEGVLLLPVGPIHAGVIEAGHFAFHIAGEVVEKLQIHLGYKHKGIEKLFEAEFTLEQGWQLAEKVSGDSSFAHSMAYCQAVEALFRVTIPESAVLWRALLLELERLYNHIADVGALAHDMAFDLIATPIGVLREEVVQLNKRLTGHRLLRGVNRLGGVEVSSAKSQEVKCVLLQDVADTITGVTERFFGYAKILMENPACRDRAITTGVLTSQEAKYRATGLVARASGWTAHDFRLRHPYGSYASEAVQKEIRKTIIDDTSPDEDLILSRQAPVFRDDLKGDVFARIAIRVAEVETSARIILKLIPELEKFDSNEKSCVSVLGKLSDTPNFEFGLGYVEGWRGDIVYWVMKGPNNSIARCKVRDPSCFNWPAMSLAVVRKPEHGKANAYSENILADFPLVNKSFNLSYSGNDL